MPNVSRMVRVRIAATAMVALPVFVAVAVACSTAQNSTVTSDSSTTEAPSTTGAPAPPEDVDMQPTDFPKITDMTPVRHFYIANKLGHLDQALAVANNPNGGVYPVGTLIQLIPTEAMVKRAPGYDPATSDWEFFRLKVAADGTTVADSGGAKVVNQFGGNCLNCHAKADKQFDLLCEDTHGCDPLPFTFDQIKVVQSRDPRPSTKPA
jgi:hypothetical protein